MARCLTCETTYPETVAFCPKDGTALGDRLLENRYRIVSKLGAGGMGTVYLAEHVTLGKRVAVKILKEEISRDPSMAKRFEQEAVAASRIGQENIVDVTDYGRTPEGSLYFVMEYLEGRTLADLLQRERSLPVGRACHILMQVCEAIEAAHARGIVHRDLKPHNIVLLEKPGRPDFVKVLDFGISKMGFRAEPITEQGAILGTPEYMAPEQASGESVDPRTDIYAIGVIAYELITGTLPFRGDHSVATMLKHINEKAEPPRQRRPDLNISDDLEAAIMKALAKRPEDRPQSVTEQRLALAKHLVAPIPLSTAVAAAPTLPGKPPYAEEVDGRSDTFVRSSGPKAQTAPPLAEQPLIVPKSKGPWIGLGVVGLALVVGIIAFATRGGGDEPTAPADAPVAAAPTPSEPAASAPAAATPPNPTPTPAVAAAPAATAPAPTTVSTKLAVRSTPPGAAVFRGRKRLGLTPLELDLLEAATDLRFELSGYQPLVHKVGPGDSSVDVILAKRAGKRQSAAKQDGKLRDDQPEESQQSFDRADDLKASPF